MFLPFLEAKYISQCAFSETLNFAVFKIFKTASIILNEEQHEQPKNEELETFKRVILLFLLMFFESFLIR